MASKGQTHHFTQAHIQLVLVVVAPSGPFAPVVSVAGFEGLEEFLADHWSRDERWWLFMRERRAYRTCRTPADASAKMWYRPVIQNVDALVG